MPKHNFNEELASHLFKGLFGFEKENIRIDHDGKLALSPHPASFGDKSTHPYITTDFSESQLEMISPPLPSIKESLGFLETLQDLVSLEVEQTGELLWPQSSPPILPANENDIPIADYGTANKSQSEYRLELAKTYGRKRQMFSGIHFNVSFDERVIKLLHKSSNTNQEFPQFREKLYMKTVRNFLRYRWFIISLLSASPVIHKSYQQHCVDSLPQFTDDSHHFIHASSMRNSVCGYKNNKEFPLNYNSLSEYFASLDKVVDEKIINDVRENYSAIRIKTLDDDISHIEVRTLDLNPYHKAGVDKLHAEIIHIFLIFCLLKDEEGSFCADTQARADLNHEIAAHSALRPNVQINIDNKKVCLQKSILNLFKEIQNDLGAILPETYQEAMAELSEIVTNLDKRPAQQLLTDIERKGFIDWHIKQATYFLGKSYQERFIFHGLRDMELSTQLLLRRATFRGISSQIMDKSENFICLQKDGKTEYIMQATRTSIDNYASVLLMENKVMTKKVLDANDINTPPGRQYYDIKEGIEDFIYYKNQAIVIKPKSTNFGIGISIIKENSDLQIYKRALEIGFENDNTVLVETFMTGKEYRFFVINEQVQGILHRVPANIKGDGIRSIGDLVKEKNTSPLRGKGYITPLEEIALGEAEEMFLAAQGLNFTSVPQRDEIIYIRENSNISTGGDSIDYTEQIHPSYKEIASKAAQALDVNITGLDMMIEDITAEATKTNYSIIEMNFNPALHIHCHPFIGKNRHIDDKVLDALGF
ncbi:MAG: bifunctional glutamate--cysteine ligase GshA/glutathione synthetase GshB [Desulfotalea sp.]